MRSLGSGSGALKLVGFRGPVQMLGGSAACRAPRKVITLRIGSDWIALAAGALRLSGAFVVEFRLF